MDSLKSVGRYFFLLCWLLFPLSSLAATRHLTLLHFNDFHSKFQPVWTDQGYMGGAAYLAGVIKRIEKENRQKGWTTYLLFGGDALTGSVISTKFKGEAEFRFFNLIGVDAMTLGNHEFDLGSENIQKQMKQAYFPILSANIFLKGQTTPLSPAFTILTDDLGPALAVLGLTTADTQKLVYPIILSDLEFRDEVATTQALLPNLAAPLQIALTHLGVKRDIELAKKFPKLDAIIGGHDHVPADEYCRLVRQTPVCQTPPNGTYLGRLDFEIDWGKPHYLSSALIPITAQEKPVSKIKRWIKQYERRLGKEYNEVIGWATCPLIPTREGEFPLGQIAADALRKAVGTDIYFINNGNFRGAFREGRITWHDLYEVFPFGNTAVTFKMTGRQLKQFLDSVIQKRPKMSLQVSGLTFTNNGQRASQLKINGQDLKPSHSYQIAASSYVASGASIYSYLKKIQPKTDTGLKQVDLLINYIKKKGTIGGDSWTPRILQK